jgi:hypothetical protein
MFEVRSPSPNAPVISNLTLDSSYASSSRYSNYISYSGKFDFQDADGDLTSGSNVFLMIDIGTGSEYITLVYDGGSYFNQNGKTSGTISFSFQETFGFWAEDFSGKVPIMCMIQDAAGNLSNTVRATVSHWTIPVL